MSPTRHLLVSFVCLSTFSVWAATPGTLTINLANIVGGPPAERTGIRIEIANCGKNWPKVDNAQLAEKRRTIIDGKAGDLDGLTNGTIVTPLYSSDDIKCGDIQGQSRWSFSVVRDADTLAGPAEFHLTGAGPWTLTTLNVFNPDPPSAWGGNATSLFSIPLCPSMASPVNSQALVFNSILGCWSQAAAGGIASLNGLSVANQLFSRTNDANVTLTIGTNGTDTHTFLLGWNGALAKNRQHAATVYGDQANTFGAFLQRFQAGTNFQLTDQTDTTKVAQFDLSNLGTGLTRTLTWPNANTVLPQSYSCTNQVTTALNGTTGATTCTTITSAFTSGTFSPSAHNLLSASHSDTTAASAVRGDIVAAIGATTTWQRVPHSSASGGYWKWNGTDVVASTGAASGTGACGANTWASTLNADTAPTCTQPSFTNLNGSILSSQIPVANDVTMGGIKGNGTDTFCSGTDKMIGWDLTGTMQCSPDFNSTKAALRSTYTNTTTGATNVTGLSFPVLPNGEYSGYCELSYQVSATTAGLRITWTAPASPLSIMFSAMVSTSATTQASGVGTTGGTLLAGAATSTITTNFPAHLAFRLRTGNTGGTLQLQAASFGTGTLTIQSDSFCVLE